MSSLSSRIPEFRELRVAERRNRIRRATSIGEDDTMALDGGLSIEIAERMVENVVGTFALPLGIATNFTVNKRDYLVPMVIEEPSVIAAASHGAKLARTRGGFHVAVDAANMIAQVHLIDVPNTRTSYENIRAARGHILELANSVQPRLVARGGGATDIEVRLLGVGHIVVHIIVDCRDAMGANIVNTVAEAVAPMLADLTRSNAALRILSNLADRRLVHASCEIASDSLAFGEFDGLDVAVAIATVSRIAEVDTYRTATHNKGILNGIDAVALATGNDWRAIEAGAHAFAARHGRYEPLSRWTVSEQGILRGSLTLPLALGTVGAALRAHQGAQTALRILGATSARELAAVTGAVGLATNLAALRALATEGIQRGHMRLHHRVTSYCAAQ